MDYMKNVRFKGISPFEGKIWLSSPTMHGQEQRYVDEAIRTNWVSTVGANINEVEKQIAKYVGCQYAVALGTGTASLHLATKLAGERIYGRAKPNKGTLCGHRVFCSDVTFDASVNPVAYEDGEAIFIDAERDTWNMDPAALEKAFKAYPDVKLIVLAHLYGTPGKMDEIRKIADDHGALIIEDAAESLGAKYYSMLFSQKNVSKKNSGSSEGVWIETGALGDYNCISFNGNKIITGSSGGMFLTDSKDDADKVRKWSTQSREVAPWYQHEEIGYNYRISNVVAGVVRGQIPWLDEHIIQKKKIYERYKEAFKDLPVTMNPIDFSRSKPNYWISCMLIDEKAMAPMVRGDKDYSFKRVKGKSSPQEILEVLSAFNAEGRPIWKPMHIQPIYRNHAFVTAEADDNIDVGSDIFRRGLCLPSDNKMTEEQQDIIIELVHRCFL